MINLGESDVTEKSVVLIGFTAGSFAGATVDFLHPTRQITNNKIVIVLMAQRLWFNNNKIREIVCSIGAKQILCQPQNSIDKIQVLISMIYIISNLWGLK